MKTLQQVKHEYYKLWKTDLKYKRNVIANKPEKKKNALTYSRKRKEN